MPWKKDEIEILSEVATNIEQMAGRLELVEKTLGVICDYMSTTITQNNGNAPVGFQLIVNKFKDGEEKKSGSP